MGTKTKPKMPKDRTVNSSIELPKAADPKKERKKQQGMMTKNAKKGSPDLAENDDKGTSVDHQMQGTSPQHAMPRRQSRIARVEMDGSITYSEDDRKDLPEPQQQSPTKSKSPKKKKESIIIQDPKLAKKIAKYLAKKERKRKRRERFRRGPVPLRRQFSHDSLGDMSKSTIENLYGPVSVSGTTSRNLSPTSADRSMSPQSKTQGTIMGSIDLDSDNDVNWDESGGHVSSSNSSENDDLLREAVVALEKYQNAYLSSQSDTDDYVTDGSMDDDDNYSDDDASGEATEAVETRRTSSRKSLAFDETLSGVEGSREQLENGSAKGSDKVKAPHDDFIIKHIKKQASKQQLLSRRTSTDVDGHNASNTALDLLKLFPPEQIEINQKEQDCVSVDISLDLDLEDGTGQDEEHEARRDDTKQQKGKNVEPSKSPLKRKKTKNVTSKQRNHDTPVEDYVQKSVAMESQDVVDDGTDRKRAPGRRRLVLCGLMVLVVGGLTALIIWILSMKGIIDLPNDQDVTPTTPPVEFSAVTSPNYPLVSNAVQIDFGNTTFRRLQDPRSPQAQAAAWFATEDTFLSFPLAADDVDSRKIFRQRYAMATLYYATDGPKSWHNQFGFLSTDHICDWTKSEGDIGGVFCLGETVLGITLPANKLHGSIPDEIWALEDLQVLELDENAIEGSIPEGISRLSRLQTLSLSGNPLSGTLPTSLGLLANLTRLAVSDCALTGQLPDELANTGLETLLLDGNGFVGTVPAAYSRLPLEEFAIQRNMISGDLTNTICSIGTLESATADCKVLCGCCVECF